MSNRRSIVKRGKIRRSRSLEQEARLLLWVRTQTGRIMECIERGENVSWSDVWMERVMVSEPGTVSAVSDPAGWRVTQERGRDAACPVT